MIFKSLFTLFRTGVFAVLLNDYLKRTFPEEYTECLIQISLKAIHLYSKLQIVTTKVCMQTKEFVNTNPFLKKIFDEIYKTEVINEICQVKPGEIYIKPITTNILDVHFEENKKTEKQESCFYIF